MQSRFYRWIAVLSTLVLVISSCTPMATLGMANLNAAQAPVTPRLYLPVVENSPIVGAPPPTPVPTATKVILPTPTATATFQPTPTLPPQPTATPGSGGATILAAGDIAMCGRPGVQQTEAMISSIPGTVLALGDNAYDSGTLLEYDTCYDPYWGTFKNRTMPVPGNHDYLTAGATGYFSYYGTVAGDPTKGYYSFNVGSWHVIAINSNCSQIGGCGPNNPQSQWLAADLAANPAQCTLAFWHHPYYSSGQNGDDTEMANTWSMLYNAGVELVLSGHDHDYERFAPQGPAGTLDTAKGIVQFVVGTGGSDLGSWVLPYQPNSITRQNSAFGVLELKLNSGSYSWKYMTVDNSYSDSGSANCH